MSIFELMAAPFVECLILVAIHTYLGLHVLRRRVIFVDLALAQIAALGTTVGFLFGIMPETPGALIFSIAFTSLGAGVFCITRFRNDRIPQEAIIGLAYAVSCAVAVIVVEKTRGAEHLKDILTGNLLWVQWSDVGLAGAAYSAIGLVHVVFRRRFLLISDDPEAAYRAGVSVRAWDFLFYFTFGIVISLSVRVAGVLLVFVFLVAPAILAFVLTSRLKLQLLIGWGTGTLVTVAGLYVSWALDLPSGPAVIALYAVALVLAGVAVYVARAPNRCWALVAVVSGVGVTALVSLAIWSAGRWIGTSDIAVSAEAQTVEQDVTRERDLAVSNESEERKRVRQALLRKLNRCVDSKQIDVYLSLPGPEERLARAREQLKTSKQAGLELVLTALADDELPLLYREEGSTLLQEATAQTFGYDSAAEGPENAPAIQRICDRVRALKTKGEASDPR
jgi:zinc/manganese transport system permease protein